MKSGQSLKRTDAYKQLAEFVCQQCKCNWDAKILKNRFNAWITRYKKARSDADQTGFGVTETDVNRGIETIEEKLEHMCPQYSRLDKLYGERVNINPVAVAECGVGESDDDDNQSVENDKDDDSDSAGSQDEIGVDEASDGDIGNSGGDNEEMDDEVEVLRQPTWQPVFNLYDDDPSEDLVPFPDETDISEVAASATTKTTRPQGKGKQASSKKKPSTKSSRNDADIKAEMEIEAGRPSKRMDFPTQYRQTQLERNEILVQMENAKQETRKEKLQLERMKWEAERLDKREELKQRTEMQQRELDLKGKKQKMEMILQMSKELGVSFAEAADMYSLIQ
ncbi:hypothetical protein BDR26DRAFT_894738 [Obelidium mucronatum]|nr:hypothetical protein BDR26DRAFT_894738 [Obelidium mucronatum]